MVKTAALIGLKKRNLPESCLILWTRTLGEQLIKKKINAAISRAKFLEETLNASIFIFAVYQGRTVLPSMLMRPRPKCFLRML
jgi:hypothetical protein